jgi:ATP-binding cassette subfamily B protein
MLLAALLRAASTYATGRLEPKVERVATEQYLERAAAVELAAIEDHAFHKLLDTAQYGAASARRMIMYGTRVINAMISLVAAAGVLTVLHPALLPLLVTMTLPSAWSALTVARRRYESFHAWVQHARAGRLLGNLLIEPEAAPEIRVHGVGAFLLRHFRAMSETAEAEQARLARLAARTGLIAAAWTGLATVATYATLGGLLLAGAMALSVAGTAVIAIRTGSQSLDTLVVEVNALHEEALFVGDLHRLYTEADQWAIPAGGAPLPEDPREIRFENVTFRYPGDSARPALDDVSLTLPLGRIVALVGENGSGKTTLVKLLAGLYTPEKGRILWDGVDTATADRHRLAERIAMVAQDFKRWPFTARVNVALGRPSAPVCEQRLAASIAEAGAETVIADLPRGLDTLLARNFSGGHELSGGQWQRLGIARAAYRRGRILIVDEPTAALDARAELEVFERIRALADSGQTVVLITHRLASVRHADLVSWTRAGSWSPGLRTSCWRPAVSTPSCTRSRRSSSPRHPRRLRSRRRPRSPPRSSRSRRSRRCRRRRPAEPRPARGTRQAAASAPSPLRTITRNMSVARSMTTSAGRPSRRRACANSSAGQEPRGPPAGKLSSTVRPFTLHLHVALYS